MGIYLLIGLAAARTAGLLSGGGGLLAGWRWPTVRVATMVMSIFG